MIKCVLRAQHEGELFVFTNIAYIALLIRVHVSVIINAQL
jgi:hypothetical protein